MVITYTITRKEIEAIAEFYNGVDESLQLFQLPALGLKKQILLALGGEIEEEIPFGHMIVNKDGVTITTDIPQEFVVEYLTANAQFLTEGAEIIVAIYKPLSRLFKRHEDNLAKAFKHLEV